MITLKLLGGAKKAIGRQAVLYDAQVASVSDILTFLKNITSEPHLLDRTNLIIAINGIDSSALGENPSAQDGDIVTIVPVVHGGAEKTVKALGNHRDRSLVPRQEHNVGGIADSHFSPIKIKEYYVLLTGVSKIPSFSTPGAIIDKIRLQVPQEVVIQGIDAGLIFGRDHLVQIVTLVIEASNRGIMIAKRIEVELLLRFALTTQIAKAILIAGIKQGRPACFIVISKNLESLESFYALCQRKFFPSSSESAILPTAKKMHRIIELNSWKKSKVLNEANFADFLTERAAIMVA